MSTNRTLVQFIASQAIAGSEAVDRLLHGALLRLEPGELPVTLAQRTKITGDERADGAALFGRPHTSRTVDIIGN